MYAISGGLLLCWSWALTVAGGSVAGLVVVDGILKDVACWCAVHEA